jgi:hypothetical protein
VTCTVSNGVSLSGQMDTTSVPAMPFVVDAGVNLITNKSAFGLSVDGTNGTEDAVIEAKSSSIYHQYHAALPSGYENKGNSVPFTGYGNDYADSETVYGLQSSQYYMSLNYGPVSSGAPGNVLDTAANLDVNGYTGPQALFWWRVRQAAPGSAPGVMPSASFGAVV